jgi:flagellar protein FliO/FliZ
MTGGLGAILTASGALVGVLGLIAVSAGLMRRGLLVPRGVLAAWAPRPATDRRLALRETMALDNRRRLHLVQCGDRQVVVLTGGAQDLVVGWIEPASGGPA